MEWYVVLALLILASPVLIMAGIYLISAYVTWYVRNFGCMECGKPTFNQLSLCYDCFMKSIEQVAKKRK